MGAPAVLSSAGLRSSVNDVRAIREVCIGSSDQIPLGQGLAYHVGKAEIAVFRLRDGSFRAIDNNCPHRGAPLSEGIVGDGMVVCPFHAWKFSLSTGDCQNDAIQLRTYAVREEAGRLYLEMP